jgi:type II secretory ATPase GspE/PulE/Tfp pilus assembly ATPase PilB-like protein
VPGNNVIERDAMTKLLRAVITMAVRQRASDLMVETEADALKVRARIDGIMYDLESLPRNVASSFISAIKVATNLDITEKRVPQDGKFSMSVDDQNVDLRVNTSPSPQGERATIRLLTHKTLRLEPAKLGLEGRDLEIFAEAIHRPHGLVIVTGPTGSGKSTTIYVALNELNRGDKNIVTIEDPIEYQIKGISQMQVNVAQNFTFATGLRSMLRQGPDVIMVGEIRDQETAMIAVEAAATGHLVFTTLHTIDSPTAFTRLADLGIETRRMASAIACIIAQRLCRVVCPDCLTEYKPPLEVLAKLGLVELPGGTFSSSFANGIVNPLSRSGAGGGGEMEPPREVGPIYWRGSDQPLHFVRGKGCPTCMQTGFHGRVGIFEFLVPNDELRDAIEKNASVGNIRELARKNGMRTLREAGIDRIAATLTSPEEILRVTAT